MSSNLHSGHDDHDDVNKVVMWLYSLMMIGSAMFLAIAHVPPLHS